MPEVDVLALEGKDCNGDSVLAADEEYEADKVLSIGMVAAKNEDKPELDRAIQAAKEVLVIAEETIEVPLKEKSTESGLLVCTSNQEVKDTPIEDTSTKDEEGEDVGKTVEEVLCGNKQDSCCFVFRWKEAALNQVLACKAV